MIGEGVTMPWGFLARGSGAKKSDPDVSWGSCLGDGGMDGGGRFRVRAFIAVLRDTSRAGSRAE